MKDITDRMPRTEKMVLIQAKGPLRLIVQVRQILDVNKWTWNDFFLAAMESFIIEWKDRK